MPLRLSNMSGKVIAAAIGAAILMPMVRLVKNS
jgi:hypothetical protein